MVISETSVRRPVFAAVISLVLVIVGVLALDRLALREYPDTNPPVVSVDTRYRGASAEIIERRVTQVLENEIAGIEARFLVCVLASTTRCGGEVRCLAAAGPRLRRAWRTRRRPAPAASSSSPSARPPHLDLVRVARG